MTKSETTEPESNRPHPGTLAEALIAFQAEMPIVGKDSTATVPMKAGGSYSYKYTDLADLTKAVIPLLVKHDLAFIVTPRMTEQGYEVVGRLLHASGDFIEAALPLYGRQPQEIGGALTYARRYLIGCLTGVVTDEDNDAAHAKEADRTPAKDWDDVVFRASTITGIDELMAFWNSERVGTAPKDIQAKVKEFGAQLRKQAELDALAEQENAKAKAEAGTATKEDPK